MECLYQRAHNLEIKIMTTQNDNYLFVKLKENSQFLRCSSSRMIVLIKKVKFWLLVRWAKHASCRIPFEHPLGWTRLNFRQLGLFLSLPILYFIVNYIVARLPIVELQCLQLNFSVGANFQAHGKNSIFLFTHSKNQACRLLLVTVKLLFLWNFSPKSYLNP